MQRFGDAKAIFKYLFVASLLLSIGSWIFNASILKRRRIILRWLTCITIFVFRQVFNKTNHNLILQQPTDKDTTGKMILFTIFTGYTFIFKWNISFMLKACAELLSCYCKVDCMQLHLITTLVLFSSCVRCFLSVPYLLTVGHWIWNY